MKRTASQQGGGDARDSKAERERRLAEALRENLRKRKEQQRARESGSEPQPDRAPQDECSG